MSEEKKVKKTSAFSPDWLVQGVLTKLGDTFDRLTGRGWNPSSSLATSKLTEKLKALLDLEMKDMGAKGKFVPHNIKLKIQWDKFSTDSEEELKKLEFELHAAAIDHINDRLYHTYAPINIEVKTDYFTEGVKLLGSFGAFSENEEDEAAINVTLPNFKRDDFLTDGKISVILNEKEIERNLRTFMTFFSAAGKDREVKLDFSAEKRLSVGRSKENGLFLNDKSVSKIHASLVLNSEIQLMVADTGSTNGTFVDGQRIAYGKAFIVKDGGSVKFGSVEVRFERIGELSENGSEEDEVQAPIMKTEAAVSLSETSLDSKIRPTEAFGPDDLDNSEASTGQDQNDEDIESSVDWSDKDSGETNGDLEVEDQASDDSNLNETQDWEI